jgi:hypothetical protein
MAAPCGYLLDQTHHGWRALSANVGPVCQTVLRKAQAFGCTFGQWVVKANTFDKTAVATVALVSYNNVKKRTGFRTAA